MDGVTPKISEEDILAELHQLLESKSFHKKRQQCNLLRYIVTQTLVGRSERLSQYAIAVDALGRNEDFCPTENPAVRIEASRLRYTLKEYYKTEGKNNKLRIELPTGCYQVVFSYHKGKQDNTEMGLLSPYNNNESSMGPRLFVCFRPNVTFEKATNKRLCYKLHSKLVLLLGRFRHMRISSSLIENAHKSCDDYDLAKIRQQYQANFILSCYLFHDDGYSLNYHIIHTLNGEIVHTGHYDFAENYDQADLDHACHCLLTETVSLCQGKALAYWSWYWLTQDSIPEPYRVLVYRVHFFQRSLSQKTFHETLDSCREALKRNPYDHFALSTFSVLAGVDFFLNYGFHKTNGALQEWNEVARLAVKTDSGNADAHLGFAAFSYLQRDYDLARAEIDTALNANPFDTSSGIICSLGLCLLDEWEQGVALAKKMMSLTETHPDFYHLIPSLYYFHRGNYKKALQEAGRIQKVGCWGELVRIATFCNLKYNQRATEELAIVRQKFPDFMESSEIVMQALKSNYLPNKLKDSVAKASDGDC